MMFALGQVLEIAWHHYSNWHISWGASVFSSPSLQRLCETVIDERLIRIAPNDQATLDSWQGNDAVYSDQGFAVQSFSPDDDQLLSAALLEWGKRESCLLAPLECGGAAFDRWFRLIVKQFHAGLEDRPWGTTLGRALGGSREIVRNISWVRAFVFFLPKYAKHRKDEIAQCGLRMAAIFYLEQMDKWFDNKEFMGEKHDHFRRIHAYWTFALAQTELRK